MSFHYKSFDIYYNSYLAGSRDENGQPLGELTTGCLHLLCSRSDHQKNVEAFMKAAGQRVRTKPRVPTTPELLLRAKLQLEECLEKISQLGVDVLYDNKVINPDLVSLDLSGEHQPNLVGIVDGCLDSIVIATGTLVACGVSDNGVQAAVDSSNMKKFGPGGYRRNDGKWVKPSDWTPPPLKELLVIQGWDGSDQPEPLD